MALNIDFNALGAAASNRRFSDEPKVRFESNSLAGRIKSVNRYKQNGQPNRAYGELDQLTRHIQDPSSVYYKPYFTGANASQDGDEAFTEGMEADLGALKQNIGALVAKGYSDNDIINRVKTGDYPYLKQADDEQAAGAPHPTTRGVDYMGYDTVYSSIQQAREGGEGTSLEYLSRFAGENGADSGFKPDKNSEASYDPQSEYYHPYAHGSTYNGTVPEEQARGNSEKAQKELDNLNRLTNLLFARGYTADQILDTLNSVDDTGESFFDRYYPTLRSMEIYRECGSAMEMTDPVDFAMPYFISELREKEAARNKDTKQAQTEETPKQEQQQDWRSEFGSDLWREVNDTDPGSLAAQLANYQSGRELTPAAQQVVDNYPELFKSGNKEYDEKIAKARSTNNWENEVKEEAKKEYVMKTYGLTEEEYNERYLSDKSQVRSASQAEQFYKNNNADYLANDRLGQKIHDEILNPLVELGNANAVSQAYIAKTRLDLIPLIDYADGKGMTVEQLYDAGDAYIVGKVDELTAETERWQARAEEMSEEYKLEKGEYFAYIVAKNLNGEELNDYDSQLYKTISSVDISEKRKEDTSYQNATSRIYDYSLDLIQNTYGMESGGSSDEFAARAVALAAQPYFDDVLKLATYLGVSFDAAAAYMGLDLDTLTKNAVESTAQSYAQGYSALEESYMNLLKLEYDEDEKYDPSQDEVSRFVGESGVNLSSGTAFEGVTSYALNTQLNELLATDDDEGLTAEQKLARELAGIEPEELEEGQDVDQLIRNQFGYGDGEEITKENYASHGMGDDEYEAYKLWRDYLRVSDEYSGANEREREVMQRYGANGLEGLRAQYADRSLQRTERMNEAYAKGDLETVAAEASTAGLGFLGPFYAIGAGIGKGVQVHATGWMKTAYFIARKDRKEVESELRRLYATPQEARAALYKSIDSIDNDKLREAYRNKLDNYDGDVYQFFFDEDTSWLESLIADCNDGMAQYDQTVQSKLNSTERYLYEGTASMTNSSLHIAESMVLSKALGMIGWGQTAANVAALTMTMGINEGWGEMGNDLINEGKSKTEATIRGGSYAVLTGFIEASWDGVTKRMLNANGVAAWRGSQAYTAQKVGQTLARARGAKLGTVAQAALRVTAGLGKEVTNEVGQELTEDVLYKTLYEATLDDPLKGVKDYTGAEALDTSINTVISTIEMQGAFGIGGKVLHHSQSKANKIQNQQVTEETVNALAENRADYEQTKQEIESMSAQEYAEREVEQSGAKSAAAGAFLKALEQTEIEAEEARLTTDYMQDDLTQLHANETQELIKTQEELQNAEGELNAATQEAEAAEQVRADMANELMQEEVPSPEQSANYMKAHNKAEEAAARQKAAQDKVNELKGEEHRLVDFIDKRCDEIVADAREKAKNTARVNRGALQQKLETQRKQELAQLESYYNSTERKILQDAGETAYTDENGNPIADEDGQAQKVDPWRVTLAWEEFQKLDKGMFQDFGERMARERGALAGMLRNTWRGYTVSYEDVSKVTVDHTAGTITLPINARLGEMVNDMAVEAIVQMAQRNPSTFLMFTNQLVDMEYNHGENSEQGAKRLEDDLARIERETGLKGDEALAELGKRLTKKYVVSNDQNHVDWYHYLQSHRSNFFELEVAQWLDTQNANLEAVLKRDGFSRAARRRLMQIRNNITNNLEVVADAEKLTMEDWYRIADENKEAMGGAEIWTDSTPHLILDEFGEVHFPEDIDPKKLPFKMRADAEFVADQYYRTGNPDVIAEYNYKAEQGPNHDLSLYKTDEETGDTELDEGEKTTDTEEQPDGEALDRAIDDAVEMDKQEEIDRILNYVFEQLNDVVEAPQTQSAETLKAWWAKLVQRVNEVSENNRQTGKYDDKLFGKMMPLVLDSYADKFDRLMGELNNAKATQTTQTATQETEATEETAQETAEEAVEEAAEETEEAAEETDDVALTKTNEENPIDVPPDTVNADNTTGEENNPLTTKNNEISTDAEDVRAKVKEKLRAAPPEVFEKWERVKEELRNMNAFAVEQLDKKSYAKLAGRIFTRLNGRRYKTGKPVLSTPLNTMRRLAQNLGSHIYENKAFISEAPDNIVHMYNERTNSIFRGADYSEDFAAAMYGAAKMVEKHLESLGRMFSTNIENYSFEDFFYDYMTASDVSLYEAGANELVDKLQSALQQTELGKIVDKARTQLRGWIHAWTNEQKAAAFLRNVGSEQEDLGLGGLNGKFRQAFVDSKNAAHLLDDYRNDLEKALGGRGARYDLSRNAYREAYRNKAFETWFTGDCVDIDGIVTGAKCFHDIMAENHLSAKDKAQLSRAMMAYTMLDRFALGRSATSQDQMRVLSEIESYDEEGNPNVDLSAQYTSMGLTEEVCRGIINDITQNSPNLMKAMEEIYKTWDTFMREVVVKEGLVTEDVYNAFVKAHPHYAPLNRYKGGEGFHIAKGNSNEQVIDPFQNMLLKMRSWVRQASQNRVRQTFDEMYRATPNLAFIADLTEENEINPYEGMTKPKGDNVIEVRRKDGTRAWYTFADKSILELFKNNDPNQAGRVLRGFSKVTHAMAMGMTTANPLFGLGRNPVKDFYSAVNHGSFASNPITGAIKWMNTAADVAARKWFGKGSQVIQDYENMGGFGYTRMGEKTKWVKGYEKDIFGTSTQFGKIITAPIHFIGDLADIFETTTRATEYKFGQNAVGTLEGEGGVVAKLLLRMSNFFSGPKGLGLRNQLDNVTQETKDAAFVASRDVTVDFLRGGNGAVLNFFKATVPFINAKVQGLDRAWRQVTREEERSRLFVRSVKSLFNNALYGIGTVMLSMGGFKKSRDDDDKKWAQWYLDLSDSLKKSHLIFPMKGADGAREWFRLPISEDPWDRLLFEAFRKSTETLLTKGELDDLGHTPFFTDMLETFYEATAGEFNPLTTTSLISPLIDVWRNKNYYGGDIVPESAQKMSGGIASLEYKDDTPHLWRWIAKGAETLLGWIPGIGQSEPMTFLYSPIKLQYMIEQYTGLIGQMFSAAMKPNPATGSIDIQHSVYNMLSLTRNRFTLDSESNNDYSDEYDDVLTQIAAIESSIKSRGSYPTVAVDNVDEMMADIKAANKKGGILYDAKRDISALWSRYYDIQESIPVGEPLSEENAKYLNDLGLTQYQAGMVFTFTDLENVQEEVVTKPIGELKKSVLEWWYSDFAPNYLNIDDGAAILGLKASAEEPAKSSEDDTPEFLKEAEQLMTGQEEPSQNALQGSESTENTDAGEDEPFGGMEVPMQEEPSENADALRGESTQNASSAQNEIPTDEVPLYESLTEEPTDYTEDEAPYMDEAETAQQKETQAPTAQSDLELPEDGLDLPLNTEQTQQPTVNTAPKWFVDEQGNRYATLPDGRTLSAEELQEEVRQTFMERFGFDPTQRQWGGAIGRLLRGESASEPAAQNTVPETVPEVIPESVPTTPAEPQQPVVSVPEPTPMLTPTPTPKTTQTPASTPVYDRTSWEYRDKLPKSFLEDYDNGEGYLQTMQKIADENRTQGGKISKQLAPNVDYTFMSNKVRYNVEAYEARYPGIMQEYEQMYRQFYLEGTTEYKYHRVGAKELFTDEWYAKYASADKQTKERMVSDAKNVHSRARKATQQWFLDWIKTHPID